MPAPPAPTPSARVDIAQINRAVHYPAGSGLALMTTDNPRAAMAAGFSAFLHFRLTGKSNYHNGLFYTGSSADPLIGGVGIHVATYPPLGFPGEIDSLICNGSWLDGGGVLHNNEAINGWTPTTAPGWWTSGGEAGGGATTAALSSSGKQGAVLDFGWHLGFCGIDPANHVLWTCLDDQRTADTAYFGGSSVFYAAGFAAKLSALFDWYQLGNPWIGDHAELGLFTGRFSSADMDFLQNSGKGRLSWEVALLNPALWARKIRWWDFLEPRGDRAETGGAGSLLEYDGLVTGLPRPGQIPSVLGPPTRTPLTVSVPVPSAGLF